MLDLDSKKHLITLIGMPASGKSFLGKKLANLLGWTCVDLDSEIEKQEQKSIPVIFEEEGESYFRKAEQKALHQALKMQNAVIATGGGSPCFFDNLEQMKERSQTVFLDVTIDEILDRVLKAPNQRPLFEHDSDEETRNSIDLLYKKRISIYQKADLTVNTTNEEQILQEIITFTGIS
jgi:shikimate kinase